MQSVENLKRAIFVRTLIAVTVITLTLIITILLPLTADLRENNSREIHFIADSKTVAVNQYTSKIINVAEQFTSRTQIRRKLMAYNDGKVNLEELVSFSHNKLLDAMKKSPDAKGITRLDINGKPVVIVGQEMPKEFMDRFVPLQQKTTIFNPYTINNKVHIIIATPIIDRNGRKVGTDIVLFHADNLKAIIEDKTGLGETGEITLSYTTRESYDSMFETIYPDRKPVLTKVRASFITGKYSQQDSQHKVCEDCVVVIRPLNTSDWHLIFAMERDELNAIINTTELRLIILSILILTIGIFGTYRLIYPLLKKLASEQNKTET